MTLPGTDAVVAQELGARLVHLSTDYIFGSEAESRATPYMEFDTPIPLSVYGKSKLAGENLVRHFCLRHFIVRASGLFGVAGSSGKGGNFIETMLRLASERDELKVVNLLWHIPYHQQRRLLLVRVHRGDTQTGKHSDPGCAHNFRPVSP